MLVAEPSQDQSQVTSAPEVELHNESTFSAGRLGIVVWVVPTLGPLTKLIYLNNETM